MVWEAGIMVWELEWEAGIMVWELEWESGYNKDREPEMRIYNDGIISEVMKYELI